MPRAAGKKSGVQKKQEPTRGSQQDGTKRAELAKTISRALPVEVLEQLADEVQEDGVAAVSRLTMSYSGPLPHSEELAKYEQIHAGAADRIIKMAEAEQAHRHEIETKNIDLVTSVETSKQRRAATGLALGTIGYYLSIAAAVALVILDQSTWTSSILGGGGLIGVLHSIVNGGRKDKGE